MQGNDGAATFIGLQEEAVVGVVVEEILGKGGCAEGVLEDEEVTFPVGIPVGIVFPELVPGEPERCSPVEAVCEPVAGGLAPGGASFSDAEPSEDGAEDVVGEDFAEDFAEGGDGGAQVFCDEVRGG